MKAFAFVLLCALAAVQGRYTAFQSAGARDLTALDENPWLVHLRIAVSTSGLLNSGAGSLISDRWVLTTAENVVDGRFIWIRYGVEDVISPSLVTETSTVSVNPNYDPTTGADNIALVSINRAITQTPNIAPIPLASQVVVGPGKVCVFGPRGVVHCFRINVAKDDRAGLIISGGDVEVTDYDFGTPLVNDDGQIGLLVGLPSESDQITDDDGGAGDDPQVIFIVGKFLATDIYHDWIEAVTGVILSPDLPDADPSAVHFV